MNNPPSAQGSSSNTFERIKRVNSSGAEFWSARDLARVLEYSDFRNFSAVIVKAREACANSGHTFADHFVDITEMVPIGSGAQRSLEDWALSRYACYRTTQTEEKLRRENVRHKDHAGRVHEEVGRKVRRTIHELGGTMPENLPIAESIKRVESREKKQLKAGSRSLPSAKPEATA